MNPELWKRVRQLLEVAMEQTPDQRRALLDDACADDEDLRREVERLLRAHDSAGTFIERPAVRLASTQTFASEKGGATAETSRVPLAKGSVVGRFVILDQVGSGGMGVVFAAYDPDLDRKVALKLLHPQRLGGEQARARLLREAQALARLSHPNVITVYEVGSVDDEVFIAMEFVEGANLKEWLDQELRPRSRVLETFAAAGRGLAAAHAAGLVHRDFKPGNVLVGGDGRVVVLDFGLARAVGAEAEGGEIDAVGPAGEESGITALDSPLTVTGALMGTPAYMAPEQVGGEAVGAPADQFTFCVALYEALYGERPFDRGSSMALSSEVRELPAGTRVPLWLRRVLLRGLRRDPAARYPSMDALLQELGRDPGRRRRRWLAAAAITLGVAAGILGLRHASRQQALLCTGAGQKVAGIWDGERRDEVRAAFRSTGAPFAEDAWLRVRTVFDAYAGAWIEMHTDACEATHLRGEQSPDLLDRRMACLDQGLRELDTLAGVMTAADTALVQRAVEAATALTPLASCADRAALTAPVAPPEDAATRARVQEVRARLAEAKAYREAAEYDRGLGLAESAAREARALGYWPLTAEALLRLGSLQEAKVRPEEAAETFGQALLAAQSGRHDRVAAEAFTRLVKVEGVLRSDPEAGQRWAEHVPALLDYLGESEALEATLDEHLGYIWLHQADYPRALERFSRALELRRRALGPQHPAVADASMLMGHAHLALGDLEPALERFREAVAVAEKALGPAHPKVATNLDSVGLVMHRLGDDEGALPLHQRALGILEAALGPEHNQLATVLTNLGNIYAGRGDAQAAMTAYRRAHSILEGSLGPDHPNVALALISIGNLHGTAGDFHEALEANLEALAIQQKAYDDDHPWMGSTFYNLGETYANLGEHATALDYYRRAVEVWEATFDDDHPLLAEGYTGLAEGFLGAGRPAPARAAAERVLTVGERVALEPRLTGAARFALARALDVLETDPERAVDLARQAAEELRQAGPRGSQKLAAVEEWLGEHR